MFNIFKLRSYMGKKYRPYLFLAAGALIIATVFYSILVIKFPVIRTICWNIYKWILSICGVLMIILTGVIWIWEKVEAYD